MRPSPVTQVYTCEVVTSRDASLPVWLKLSRRTQRCTIYYQHSRLLAMVKLKVWQSLKRMARKQGQAHETLRLDPVSKTRESTQTPEDQLSLETNSASASNQFDFLYKHWEQQNFSCWRPKPSSRNLGCATCQGPWSNPAGPGQKLDIETLKNSGNNGCALCSMLLAGIEHCFPDLDFPWVTVYNGLDPHETRNVISGCGKREVVLDFFIPPGKWASTR